jgi:tRNA pseudouridine38-40 synthase
MPRRLLTIKYDGTNYCGWQVQPNGISVQETVGNALSSVLCGTIGVTGCSRTDAGVHANMFCLHFDSNSTISNDKLVLAVNAHLPHDIAAYDCITVADDFHARYSALGKTYIYKIYNSPYRDPFGFKYSLQVSKKLDEDLLNCACKAFFGTHDFKGFCSQGSSVTDTVRTITDCSVVRHGDEIIFSITGDGFLYNMVRIIVGTLLEIGYGKINPEDLPRIISSCDRNLAGPTAKAHGLYLNKVFYKAGDING